MRRDASRGNRLRVLTSFPRPRDTTNPYISQLAAALEAEPDIEVCYFTWRTALGGRYDVVHTHWPEAWLWGRTASRRVVRLVLAGLLCLRLWALRIPAVRTVHNLEPPSDLWAADYAVLGALDRRTRVRIRLNDATEMPDGTTFVTIPHGHYRDWFQAYPRHDPVPGRMAFVGRIRRYKGVENLVELVRTLPRPDMSLTVAGLPSTDYLVSVVHALADGDPRIELRFEYVDDAMYVSDVTRASLVVLPYRHMHNSGTVLAVLSLDRPVLVPDTEVNRRLAAEVGTGWVHLFRDELTQDDVLGVMDVVGEGVRGRPDLDARGWDAVGRLHVLAYRQAIDAGKSALSRTRSSRR